MKNLLQSHAAATPQPTRVSLLTSLACVALITWIAIEGYSYASAMDALTAHIPDAVANGNIDKAKVQCRALFKAWKQSGENTQALQTGQNAQRLLFLPDRKYAEDPRYRSLGQPSFVFPTGKGNPLAGHVAFYTGVYARQNPVQIGDTLRTSPSGYFLVCWHSGKISQFPAEQVQFVESPRGDEQVPIFPGMREYTAPTPPTESL